MGVLKKGIDRLVRSSFLIISLHFCLLVLTASLSTQYDKLMSSEERKATMDSIDH